MFSITINGLSLEDMRRMLDILDKARQEEANDVDNKPQPGKRKAHKDQTDVGFTMAMDANYSSTLTTEQEVKTAEPLGVDVIPMGKVAPPVEVDDNNPDRVGVLSSQILNKLGPAALRNLLNIYKAVKITEITPEQRPKYIEAAEKMLAENLEFGV